MAQAKTLGCLHSPHKTKELESIPVPHPWGGLGSLPATAVAAARTGHRVQVLSKDVPI